MSALKSVALIFIPFAIVIPCSSILYTMIHKECQLLTASLFLWFIFSALPLWPEISVPSFSPNNLVPEYYLKSGDSFFKLVICNTHTHQNSTLKLLKILVQIVFSQNRCFLVKIPEIKSRSYTCNIYAIHTELSPNFYINEILH